MDYLLKHEKGRENSIESLEGGLICTYLDPGLGAGGSVSLAAIETSLDIHYTVGWLFAIGMLISQ